MLDLTPHKAFNDCCNVFSAFGDYWYSDDNLFRDDDGPPTICGVYAALTHFIRGHWRSFTDADWSALAAMVADHYQRDETQHGSLGACLIENLDIEEFSQIVHRFFDKTMLRGIGFMGKSGEHTEHSRTARARSNEDL